MRGDLKYYCPLCDEETIVNVADLRAAMVSLAAIGRYEDLCRYAVHQCNDGRMGIAELAEGVPTPLEGDKSLSDSN